MKSKLRPTVIIVALIALVGVVLVGCMGAGPRGWSGPAVSQGVLYLGTQDGKLIALDAQTGRWTKSPFDDFEEDGNVGFGCSSAGGGPAIYSTAVVSSDTIYIGDYEGNVWAFDLNLVPAWDRKYYKTKSHIIGNLVLSDGILYFGAANKKVYALDASTGQRLWEFKTKGKIWSTPTVADGILYIGTLDHHIYAIRTDTGEEVVGFYFEADGAIVTAPIVQGDTIYVGANDRYIYALNKADGSIKWKFKGSQWFWAQPVISGDTIYAVSLDGKVYAVKDNGNTYELLWQHDLKADVNAPPLLAEVGEKTLLFVGDHDGYLTALNTDATLSQGNLRVDWLYKFKSGIYAPLAISEDQTIVYAYTRNHELHASDAATSDFIFTFDTDDMALVYR